MDTLRGDTHFYIVDMNNALHLNPRIEYWMEFDVEQSWANFGIFHDHSFERFTFWIALTFIMGDRWILSGFDMDLVHFQINSWATLLCWAHLGVT